MARDRTLPVLGILVAALLLDASGGGASPLLLDYDTKGTTPPIGNTVIHYGLHIQNVAYKVDDDNWDVDLLPDPPTYLRTFGPASAGVLKASFPAAAGWSFPDAANELSDNSLTVRVYAARHGGSQVAAEFLVEYAPGQNDPADVHWIQVVRNNHPRNGKHGQVAHVVDVTHPKRPQRGPYYDNGGFANSRWLYDFPKREDQREHVWLAELLLVAGPPIGAKRQVAPGAVTILGGVTWGFQNECTDILSPGLPECATIPEPATTPLLLIGLVTVAVSRHRWARPAAFLGLLVAMMRR